MICPTCVLLNEKHYLFIVVCGVKRVWGRWNIAGHIIRRRAIATGDSNTDNTLCVAVFLFDLLAERSHATGAVVP